MRLKYILIGLLFVSCNTFAQAHWEFYKNFESCVIGFKGSSQSEHFDDFLITYTFASSDVFKQPQSKLIGFIPDELQLILFPPLKVFNQARKVEFVNLDRKVTLETTAINQNGIEKLSGKDLTTVLETLGNNKNIEVRVIEGETTYTRLIPSGNFSEEYAEIKECIKQYNQRKNSKQSIRHMD